MSIAAVSAFDKPIVFSEFLRRAPLVAPRANDKFESVATIIGVPWLITLKFHRVKDLERLIAVDCTENDRFKVVDGKLTLTPSK